MSDPLPRFIPGPLNLKIKHWVTLLKVLLLTDLCVCITSAVSILGAYKPCPSESRRMKLIGWTVLDIIKMKTDKRRFLREEYIQPPSLQSFEYSVLITTEASKLIKWYSDQP